MSPAMNEMIEAAGTNTQIVAKHPKLDANIEAMRGMLEK